MNSYAIYRIAETLRVLFFMTLAILIFKFYPLTAVMIVMLALLNDGAILSIAYDNVHYKDQPRGLEHAHGAGHRHSAGRHRGRLLPSECFISVSVSFISTARRIQTLMYLKLSVAGHLTIFLTRTRGPFWSIRPAQGSVDRGPRHANRGDVDRGVRAVYDTARLGFGRIRVGLCPAVVPFE